MTQIAFPFRVGSDGRTATSDEDRHVRELIEQVLFTSPGERVNRPTFGSGLLQLLFEGGGEELATATEFMVRSALQQWLGDVITVDALEITSEDARLEVLVRYSINRTAEERVASFSRGA